MAFNKLTDAQSERLALLLEELGEAQQVIGKILRHGFESFHPDRPDTTNRLLLEQELGDVRAAVDILIKAGDLNEDMIGYSKDDKLLRVVKYLHHQGATSEN